MRRSPPLPFRAAMRSTRHPSRAPGSPRVAPRAAAVALAGAVLWGAAAGAQSPVFDDDELSRGFTRGLIAVAGGEEAFTGERAAVEAAAAVGRGVDLADLAAATATRPDGRPLYDSVVPAVVAVSSIHKCSRCADWHLGGGGSGWILSPDGLVVTNHHVIATEPAHRLGVMTADGEVYAVTGVVAADPVGDAVVIRIDTRGRRLPFLRLGDAPACGTPVSVVSHPVGRYWCLTEGVVSRFHKQSPAKGDLAAEGAPPAAAGGAKPVWMSITADYTVGSSGGPVFDADGAVVGMVSRTVTSSQAKPDENRARRRPLAGETIVFKDCVSSDTLHRLVAGTPAAAGRDVAAAGR